MGTLKHGVATHHLRTKLYNVWVGMRARCRDPKHISYPHYGARGIEVDPRWDSFVEFRDWSYANGYIDPSAGTRSKLEIDRQDNDGPYSPENCKWVTTKANRRKQQPTYVAWGEAKTMVEWSEDERCAVAYYALRNRLQRGWHVEDAVALPDGVRVHRWRSNRR